MRTASKTQGILAAGRNLWRRVAVEDSRVIVDAADYYRAFYAAAERAQRSIVISGWQFDRGVELLRGSDAAGHPQTKLLAFLDDLCRRKPALHIHLLAWDFNLIFALEREWMQRLWFHYATNERLTFRFDDAVAEQGSHHQKFAVIDGREAFVGGIDLCEARWDDRAHLTDNPLRLSRGEPAKPYHDLQAHLIGPEIGAALTELFVTRWTRAGGPALALGTIAVSPVLPVPPVVPCVCLGPGQVALSRTDPVPEPGRVREVEHLFVDAIRAAERLIYIETQYFSSSRIRDALVERLLDRRRPRLEIVVIVNPRAEAWKEELAVGLRQAANLEQLRAVAVETGHALGLYYSLSAGAGAAQRTTYIHSKMMLVDDRFLTVGSANLTNRSMEVDSELHAAWEAAADDTRLCRGIRRLRVGLLAEHAGLAGPVAIRSLLPITGLVARLDALTERPGARLCRHGPPSEEQQTMLAVVDPEELPFDPAPSLESRQAR
jgi:phosphatidylserine/phosphatidylglycerophosphate/cardiolipin synthase-like enzyme